MELGAGLPYSLHFFKDAEERVPIVEQLIRAGADVNFRVRSGDTVFKVRRGRSPLEAALLGMSTFFIPSSRGVVSDYFVLEKLYRKRMTENNTELLYRDTKPQTEGPADDGITIQETPPSYVWADRVIPILLRAGAKVLPKTMDGFRDKLKK
ncbi:hypothetical protein GE09DRAFT_1058733 [Coniochaeta sp. 2T2.1]|nr:hypothetical protein GE09DRAFT_1058733 [Coniochaeta sp. 2T2.1]